MDDLHKKPIRVIGTFLLIIMAIGDGIHWVAEKVDGWDNFHSGSVPWWVWSVLLGMGVIFWFVLCLGLQIEHASERAVSMEAASKIYDGIADLKAKLTNLNT